ncbi:MAG: histidine phosphatase family protein [Erysipelotrichaceae bacterium]|nr:histidine phosphatase family protein [Erysipelotrichaceae bacterium]
MGHFYFVRHGESLWNVENKICGATDIDLTEKGFQQAEQAAESILHQELKIDMILASPLKRAYHTAQVISKRTGIPLKAEPRLTEQNFGKWEGTARDGEDFRIAKTHFIESWDGGESILKTAHRVYSLLDEITSQEETVYLLAAHNGLARIIQSYFHDMSNEEFAAFGIGNCEIRRYDY